MKAKVKGAVYNVGVAMEEVLKLKMCSDGMKDCATLAIMAVKPLESGPLQEWTLIALTI